MCHPFRRSRGRDVSPPIGATWSFTNRLRMTTPSHSYGRVLVGVTMDAMMDAEIGCWAWTTSLVRLIVGGRDSVQQRPIRVLSGSDGDTTGRGSVVVMKDLLSSRHSIRSSIATLQHLDRFFRRRRKSEAAEQGTNENCPRQAFVLLTASSFHVISKFVPSDLLDWFCCKNFSKSKNNNPRRIRKELGACNAR